MPTDRRTPLPRRANAPNLAAMLVVATLLALAGIAWPAAAITPVAGAIYVSPTGSDAGDGTRDAPFGTIQFAMDAAPEGGEVILLPGVYLGNSNLTYRGKAMTVRSEAGRDATIVSGEGLPHFEPWNTRGFHFNSGETAASILVGITITGFTHAPGIVYGHELYGAGIRIVGASPVVRDCVVSGNQTIPSLNFYVFCPCSTGSYGAGVFIDGGAPLFQGCSIVENVARSASGYGPRGVFGYIPGFGGGIYSSNATPTFEDCLIERNGAAYGAGMDVNSSELRMRRCTISNNQGTGIEAYDTDACIAQSTISGNNDRALSFDLRTPLSNGSEPWIRLDGCSVVFNSESYYGLPGIYGRAEVGGMTLRNSIVAFNDPTTTSQVVVSPPERFHSEGGNIVSRNDGSEEWEIAPVPLHETDRVSSGFALSGPRTLPNGLHYEPLPGSLPVDGGVAVQGSWTDQAGNPRVCDGDGDGVAIPDVGAVELQGGACRSMPGSVRDFLLGIPSGAGATTLPDTNGDGAIDVGDLLSRPDDCFGD